MIILSTKVAIKLVTIIIFEQTLISVNCLSRLFHLVLVLTLPWFRPSYGSCTIFAGVGRSNNGTFSRSDREI